MVMLATKPEYQGQISSKDLLAAFVFTASHTYIPYQHTFQLIKSYGPLISD